MKWMVAGAGMLMSLAGALAIVSGSSIIQIERGWASVIAGSVALAAGLILLGLAVVIARLESIARIVEARSLGLAPAESAEPDYHATAEAPEPAPEAAAAPRSASRFGRAGALAAAPAAFAPPPPREVAVEPLPTLETANVPHDYQQFQDYRAPTLVHDSAPAAEQAEPENPLRDFKFVFPPIDTPPVPEARAESVHDEPPFAEPAFVEPMPAEPEPGEPPQPAAAPARRMNLPWLRRNKNVPEPQAEPEAEPEAGRFDVVAEATAFGMRVEETVRLPEILPADEPAPAFTAPETDTPEQEVAEYAADEPVEAEIVHEKVPEKELEPYSPDWLERALAGIDEPKDLPPPRFVPPSVRRAAHSDSLQPESLHAEPLKHEETSESATEEARETGGHMNGSVSEDAVEIGRYRANDVAYIMYSDGSITAETDTGTFRFASLAELKVFIERGA